MLLLVVLSIFTFIMAAQHPTQLEYDEFTYITKMHKYLVKYLGKIFNNSDYTSHDDSKFLEPELTPYTLQFVSKVKRVENPRWKEAKEHHFSTNNHHIEFWKYYAKEEMPLERLAEAVVDMMAANFQYNLCREVTEIARINQNEFDVEKLTLTLHEFLAKPDMYTFQDRFLSEYSETQKQKINEMLQNFQHKFRALLIKEL